MWRWRNSYSRETSARSIRRRVREFEPPSEREKFTGLNKIFGKISHQHAHITFPTSINDVSSMSYEILSIILIRIPVKNTMRKSRIPSEYTITNMNDKMRMPNIIVAVLILQINPRWGTENGWKIKQQSIRAKCLQTTWHYARRNAISKKKVGQSGYTNL